MTDLVGAPWNAQQLFDPSPLTKLQDPDTLPPPAPEDMPVRSRPQLQPGYEPVGIRYGSWMFNPSLTVGGFYDSNVFSANSGRRSDIATVIEPTLHAHTLWERHGIDLTLDGQQTLYNSNTTLNQTNATFRGNAWYDISRDLTVLTNFQAAHLNEGVGTISAPANAIQPTPYDLLSGDVSVRKQLNRWAVSFGTGIKSYEFGSSRAADGALINQNSRDGQIYTVHARTDYALSDKLGWFASAEFNDRLLRGTPTQSLDSHGERVLTGVNVALTNLIMGEFGIGYIRQDFSDPTIGTIDGLAYRALVIWRPTRLIDVNLKAEQIVTETADTSAAGVIANSVQLGVDYEFRRNVIMSLTGGYENDQFHGQPRTDKVSTIDSRIKYLLNRFYAASLFYTFTERNSNVSTFSYDKHLVGINVTAQF